MRVFKFARSLGITVLPLVVLVQAEGDRVTGTIPAGSVPTFAGNPQHTALYDPAVPTLNRIRWSTTIDFNPGDDVEERKLVIKSGLEAANGSIRRDPVRPLNKPSARQEEGERKGEVIDPAAGVDADIETGPAEFGGRWRFKNRCSRCGWQIGGARRASAH